MTGLKNRSTTPTILIFYSISDDCLKPLRFISSDILQLKPIKLIAWYSFVVHFVTDLMLLLFIAYLYHDPKQNVLYIAVLIGDYYVSTHQNTSYNKT